MHDMMKMKRPDPKDSTSGGIPDLRPLLAPLIQKTATIEEVDRAARAIEILIEKDNMARKEIGRISSTIVNAGKLENYGTKHAQEYLQGWARAYGSPQKSNEPQREATDRP
jgi:hypothetical protein